MARWLVLVASIVASGGCYSEPRPACGFVCGDNNACPNGYTCSAADNRCHLDGTSVQCDSFVDAGVDAPDTTPPMVMMMNPTGTNVPLDAPLEVIFSEEVTNVDANTFGLKTAGAGFIAGDVTFPQMTPFTARFTPTAPLEGSTTYTATLTSDITDLAGNHLTATSWDFVTVPDPTPLNVTQTDPADGVTMVPIDASIRVIFNKPIATFTDTSISLDNGATGVTMRQVPHVLVLKPDANLVAATTYTVTVATDIVDSSGLSLAAPVTFSFTTL